MKNQKQISFKTQCFLSLIPYIGMFIVCFCAFINLKKLKNKTYPYMLGYWLLAFLPALIIIGITSLVAQNLLLLADLTAYSVVILMGMYFAMLVSALFGVWLQKRTLTKIERTENNAYIA